MWEELFKQLGVFTVLVSVLGGVASYLGKKYIEILGFQSQTKFALLHRTQATKMSELYEKIFDLERAMGGFLKLKKEGNNKVEIDKVVEAGGEFTKFYQNNEIWFPESLCEDFYSLNDQSSEAFGFKLFSIQLTHGDDGSGADETATLNAAAMTAFESSVKDLRPKIRKHFRELLGVKAKKD